MDILAEVNLVMVNTIGSSKIKPMRLVLYTTIAYLQWVYLTVE